MWFCCFGYLVVVRYIFEFCLEYWFCLKLFWSKDCFSCCLFSWLQHKTFLLAFFWVKRFSWCIFFQLLWTVEFFSKQSLSGGISFVYAVSVISHKCLLSSVCLLLHRFFFNQNCNFIFPFADIICPCRTGFYTEGYNVFHKLFWKRL